MLHLLSGPIIQEKKKGTILHIPTSKAADTIAFLRSIAQSFIGDHHRCGQEIELIQPAYLPTDVRESRLIASAYITDYESETVRLPAVYENTSVVLNNNIIKSMDVEKFVQGNPYCQVLLYGSVPRALQELVVQEFELDDMGSISVNWNCDVLRAMTSAFVKSVSEREAVLQAFSWARQMIDLYLIKHQISYDKRFEMAELYLVTAKLLKKKIKQLSEGKAGGCCLKRGDNRDYFGKDNPRKRSVRLIINQLDFLPKEQQNALKAACYPNQTDNSK